MSIPSSLTPLFSTGAGGAAGYQVSRSLRFNSSDSGFLSRTPAVAGDRKKWTWSGWLKKSNVAATQGLFTCTAGGAYFELFFDNTTQALVVDDGGVYFYGYTSATSQSTLRDPSAWYHIVLALDSANATQADRLRLWVNGRLVGRSAELVLDQEYNINVAGQHEIGQWRGGSYLSGYLAEIHFIDGQALDYTSFTEVSATTGQLIPKAYTGSFGTNGFWLKFSDNSAATAATLGKDYSGNSNNWTPNNLSVTAGAGNDSLVDTPTSFGTDTGVGGEVRGNYCTANPLASAGTFTDGNLNVSVGPSIETSSLGTFRLPASGKWYWELEITAIGSDNYIGISDGTSRTSLGNTYFYYRTSGNKHSIAVSVAYGSSYTTGTILGIAVNSDAGEITFYNNGTSQGVAFTGITASDFFPSSYRYNNASHIYNFGQRPFAYAAPSGYKALVDTNLPSPVVAKPNELFDALIWSGDSVNNRKLTTNFGPDLFWAKQRNGGAYHSLNDSVRGPNAILQSNTTSAEQVNSNGYVITFASDGVNVTNGSDINESGRTYVGWAWDAGTSTVSNTQGSITSQVRANVSAGFSIVTYTGTGANATVGHGLGIAPQMLIIKQRTNYATTGQGDGNWIVGHTGIIMGSGRLILNGAFGNTDAGSPGPHWNSTAATSTLFSLGTSGNVNGSNGATYVCYAFAPVVGYSSFGSYTGNGSGDGPFVYTGFRPRWVMIKNSSATANWKISDSARDPSNLVKNVLLPNLSNAEDTAADYVDFVSNGFKIKAAPSAAYNANGNTYVFVAFAENPFQYARAR